MRTQTSSKDGPRREDDFGLVRNLGAFCEKVVLTLFGGGEQLSELRSTPQTRYQGIGPESSVSAVAPFDGTSDQPHSDDPVFRRQP